MGSKDGTIQSSDKLCWTCETKVLEVAAQGGGAAQIGIPSWEPAQCPSTDLMSIPCGVPGVII